jgi:hypothetical protein
MTDQLAAHRTPPLGRFGFAKSPAGQRSLADLMDLHQVRHRFPLPGGRHHFFELMSRSMALSSICSANSFFSLPFSSSKARNRFASEGSIPPYFDLYL